MRAFVAGTTIAMALAAYACDSFEESNTTPPNDAGDEGSNVSDGGPGDATADQGTGCEGEPEWATTTSAQTTAICDGAQANLLVDPKHCGRCNHSCGAETCTNGTCGERKEDDIFSVPYVTKDGVLFYARRPPGLGHEIARIEANGAKVVLARLDADASSGEREVLGLAAGDALYVRTQTSLRKTSLTTPTDVVPEYVADLTDEIAIGAITLGPGGVVYAAAPGGSRIDMVAPDGGVSPFIAMAAHPGEMRTSGARHVWLTQPFLFIAGGASIVYVHENGASQKIYESSDHVGGLAVDGDEAFVMRRGAAGAIMRLALPTLSTSPFLQDDLENPPWQLSVVVDATHVYWLKSLDALGREAEIWKKARCGGAAVRIGRHATPNRLVVFGDRLYIGADDGLYSIAK